MKDCPKELVNFLEGEFFGWCAWAKVPVCVDLSIDPYALRLAARNYENHYQCRETYDQTAIISNGRVQNSR